MKTWLKVLAAIFVFLTLCGCTSDMHEPYLSLYGGRAEIHEGSIKGSMQYSSLFPPPPPMSGSTTAMIAIKELLLACGTDAGDLMTLS